MGSVQTAGHGHFEAVSSYSVDLDWKIVQKFSLLFSLLLLLRTLLLLLLLLTSLRLWTNVDRVPPYQLCPSSPEPNLPKKKKKKSSRALVSRLPSPPSFPCILPRTKRNRPPSELASLPPLSMSLKALNLTYRLSFLVHLATVSLTILALWHPYWVVDGNEHLHVGLAERCVDMGLLSSSSPLSEAARYSCDPFPKCKAGDETFCVAWQTAAFTMWITVVLQFASAITYLSAALGDQYFVETGWRIISYFIAGTVVVQGVSAMTISALYSHHPAKFGQDLLHGHPPSKTPLILALGMSWWMAAASSFLSAANTLMLVVVGYMNPPEYEHILGDYVCILDEDETEDEDDSRDFYYYMQRSQLENLNNSRPSSRRSSTRSRG